MLAFDTIYLLPTEVKASMKFYEKTGCLSVPLLPELNIYFTKGIYISLNVLFCLGFLNYNRLSLCYGVSKAVRTTSIRIHLNTALCFKANVSIYKLFAKRTSQWLNSLSQYIHETNNSGYMLMIVVLL